MVDAVMAGLTREISALSLRNNELTKQLSQANGKVRALEALVNLLKVSRTPQGPIIEDTMMRRLLQLCHPDKHHGSEAANIVTKWLLNIRSKGD